MIHDSLAQLKEYIMENEKKQEKNKEEKRKVLTVRVSKEMWKFLRIESFKQEISTNELILLLLEKYKKKIEKSID